MAKAKRHHFVPKAFLERFGRDRLVAMRWRGSSEVIPTGVINVAVESGLYTTEGDGGNSSTHVEDALAGFDGRADAAIRALLESDISPPSGSDAREDLALFIAIQCCRTPEARERVTFPHRVAEFADGRTVDASLVAEYLETVHLGFAPSEGEVRGALEMVKVYENLGGLSRNDSVTLPLSNVEPLALVLLEKNWSIEIARKPRFLTSDTPVVIWRKPSPIDRYMGYGVGNADEIRFVVSPRVQIVLRDKTCPEVVRVEPDRVRECNSELAAACHRFIIGHPDRLYQLQRIPLARSRPTMRFNYAPGFTVSPTGEHVPIGDVMHMWVQRSAPVGRKKNRR